MNAHLVVNNTSEVTAFNLRDEYVRRISSMWDVSRDAVIEIGRELQKAKVELGHGSFTAMIYADLPFGPDTARKFMRLAEDKRLTNQVNSPVLPKSTEALDILRRLPPDKFERHVAEGKIHANMTIEDCKMLHPIQRTPHSVTPREPNELRDPITDADELLATMIGYRKSQGVAGEALGEMAGTADRYIAKLEVDMRRSVNESWWLWMGALKLVMILVPAKDAIRADICPCCRRAKA